MITLHLTLPFVASPVVLALPQTLAPQALRELENAVAGEIEYLSWLPDPAAIEYASWAAHLQPTPH